ncbi:alpha/beta hydrolase [Thalassotalea marina]|uniref:Esterase n=1 Tax=Thalassotalea marina TaxID=1673741 RepID=A0A919BFW2_9GAMM|nr:alpha/beta hydrolase [Thalassotalea marina]GHF87620.1 esterase [Thalassotalea marina]
MYRNFDLATLEKEYSPSSCVEDINVYIEQYIEQSKKQKQQAKLTNSLRENLSYGASPEQTLDLFIPNANVQSQHKLMVYIHGGYWQELSKEESCFAAGNFQQHGIHFAVINYTLAPKATLSEIVAENRRALAWLFHHAHEFGYQADEIYLAGSSAGAHLVTLMALTDWHQHFGIESQFIKGICAVSGIYDLTPIQQTYINEPLQLSQQDVSVFSPLLTKEFLTKFTQCKTIIALGENETQEFKRQSLEFYQMVCTQQKNCEFKQIASRNHFDVILDLADSKSWLFQQVLKQMQ